MPTGTPDYSKACIYKIWSHLTDRIYIGSTCDMTKRWSWHKSTYKSWKKGIRSLTSSYLLFDSVGVENCEIEWLHDFPCETKKQLNKEEGRVQRQYKDLLVNKKLENGLEHIEYSKIYYQEHKVLRLSNFKKWNELHKTERDEYHKKYNEEHKAEIAEYHQKNKAERNEKAKQRYQEHKAEIAEKGKKYYEEHKAEKSEKAKQRYRLKKELKEQEIKS